MKQRWTFRCYPSPEQEQILARTFGCCRFVYNWALEQRTTAFKSGGRMTYAQSSAALTKLKREPDTICIEDLNLRGMVKNHSLARSLSDAGIGTAVRMLEEKAERYGKRAIRVDRFFPSSKMCSGCGHVVSALPLSIREWTCQVCGSLHDRDVNAALNLLAAGQAVAAHGEGVRDVCPSG